MKNITCMKTVAQELLSDAWKFNPEENMLILSLGSSSILCEYKIIQEGNFLEPEFKTAITKVLGGELLEGITGPFGDDDLFSGFNNPDGTTNYFIKLCGATKETVQMLLNHSEVKATVVQ